MFSKLAHWPEQRLPWLLLAGIAFILEAAALFFQYAMDLGPCVMCIYQRTAMLGLLFAGIAGAIKPQNVFARVIGFTLWAISAIWGYLIAAEHIAMQNNTDPFAFAGCAFEPNFPAFLPLHQLVPWFFEVTGDCGNISWQFLGLSMPGWMQVIFAIASTVLFIVLVTRLVFAKKI
ncbi:disulfide bond formation protein DsbB [Pseudoalteromonas piratica]|uniref:Disulfide bond formation protein B n=1 Tax=Pseudoalteromonas piratica TaxID=1348114 RepID=A0A0A7EEC9_9GAMM|nr:disulfide bond formation protein DsbB [Pseudoalteromonas piratica]AIY65000.1 disulfide bond formation protein DsbB [Pseudoalteromonas piratica]